MTSWWGDGGNFNPGIRLDTSHVNVGGYSQTELWWKRAQWEADQVRAATTSAQAKAEAELRIARDIEDRRRKTERDAHPQVLDPRGAAEAVFAWQRKGAIEFQREIDAAKARRAAIQERQLRDTQQDFIGPGAGAADMRRRRRPGEPNTGIIGSGQQLDPNAGLPPDLDDIWDRNFKRGVEDALPRGWNIRWK